jgi:DnaK suppressor protein
MKTYDRSMAPRFKQLLSQRETELRAILHATEHSEKSAEEVELREVVDFKDLADELTQAGVDEAQAEHAAQELELVRAARRRLDEHTYGHCLDCGNAIDLRRLTALPAAPFCTTCQAKQEEKRLPRVHR